MALNNFVSLGQSGGTQYVFTDQGRTFSISRDERSVPVSIANGSIRKYFMGIKHTFSMEWNFLPGEASKTFDKKEARNTLKSLVDLQDTLTLTIQRSSAGSPVGTTTSYTVWVESYNEEIIRRDFSSSSPTIWYNIKLELKEQ